MPTVDIVYQATGKHAWCIRDGWTATAQRLGCLNRVFEPRANWGDSDTADDDGLYAYLAAPSSDVMILLGFDWHSQALHTSSRWKERWAAATTTKVLYIHESLDNNCRLFGNDGMKNAALSAVECADVIVCPDPVDAVWLRTRTTKPVFIQPYGVDEGVFSDRVPFNQRKPRPFFRGNTTPYNSQATYSERRTLIEHLSNLRLLDLLPFDHAQPGVDRFVEDYNAHQIAVAFPSLSIVHSTRVFEAMACGCAVVSCRTGRPEQDALFESGKHLLYYSDAAELADGVQRLLRDPGKSAAMAASGRDFVLGGMTLAHRLREILGWCTPSIQTTAQARRRAASHNVKRPIVVDGVMFQLHRSRPFGIARVWQCLLAELAKSSLADRILLLDRDNTAPRIPGLRTRPARQFDFNTYADDPLHLQQICDEENAALFISTYLTWPETTPSALMLHDMIPEVRGLDLNDVQWQAKLKAIDHAFAHFFVSESTRRDFNLLYPQHANRPSYLTRNAVADEFRLRTGSEIDQFRKKHGIQRPYFMLTGSRTTYKNAMLFFRAFQLLEDRTKYAVVCTGRELESYFRPFVAGAEVHSLSLDDQELSTALSGAIALVYPSQYEGFGLPILEAQRSGCPVITCRNSSIPEVAGEAAIFVGESDVAAMKAALVAVQAPDARRRLIASGQENTQRFSWSKTGEVMGAALEELLVLAGKQPAAPGDPISTATRLRSFLQHHTKASEDLLRAILVLNDSFRERRLQDRRSTAALIATVGAQLPPLMAQVTPQLAGADECDGALSLLLGIALQTQQRFPAAMQRYLRAMKRQATYNELFRVQLALRIAELSLTLGQYAAARDTLQRLILSTSPNDAAATALLTRIARAETQGRRGPVAATPR
ncbi:glycosyltransferase [Opitutus sp. ER46]|uniref:glycosyltransferase family protein n=1 Tax=Opitutus sp. ER46 TaxID=2161864 RepID=UPI001304E9E8|nr:glycosyltransferase [Opitutus sp. ER46]